MIQLRRIFHNKAYIESRIVRDKDRTLAQNARNSGSTSSIPGASDDHVVVDTCQLLNSKRNRHIAG